MSGSQRAAERRVRALLLRSQIVFLHVGARAGEDTVIIPWVDLPNGATTSSRQFNAIVRRLVEVARAPSRRPTR